FCCLLHRCCWHQENVAPDFFRSWDLCRRRQDGLQNAIGALRRPARPYGSMPCRSANFMERSRLFSIFTSVIPATQFLYQRRPRLGRSLCKKSSKALLPYFIFL